jgi:adenylate cyclase
MVHFRDPAVLAALGMVEEFPQAGLPPAHVGVAAGPVVVQGGDYFGRTVNWPLGSPPVPAPAGSW